MIDYSRGLVTSERLARLQDHLNSCVTCSAAAALYERITTAAFTTVPPVSTELIAKAKAVFRSKEHPEPELRRRFVRQIMPGGGDWAVAGLRSAVQAGVARHAVYQCGDYYLDLRSETQPDTVRVALVGQLTNPSEPDQEFEDVQVRLVTGIRAAERTSCNRRGEFSLSYVPAPRLHLEIELLSSNVILRVPLQRLYLN